MAYDIVIVAGQSNASGNGKGNVRSPFIPSPKIFTYKDEQKVSFELNDLNNPELQIDRDWHFALEQTKEREDNGCINASFPIIFAREYVNKGYLAKDRKLLLVYTSVGGAGFSRSEWGVGNVLHDRLVDMVDSALKLEENSKLVAFLWHQGEHDTFENAHLNFEERYNFYYDKLKKTVLDIRNRYSDYKFPFIAGEMVNDWVRQYPVQCKAVTNATVKVCSDVVNATLVSAKGLKSNREELGIDDTAHFCRKSIYKLGKRYFNAYKKLIK